MPRVAGVVLERLGVLDVGGVRAGLDGLCLLFHLLDEAEVRFPFDGVVELEDPESHESLQVDAVGYRQEYVTEVEAYRTEYRLECQRTGVDYVPLDTSMQFDKALMEYLLNRQTRC